MKALDCAISCWMECYFLFTKRFDVFMVSHSEFHTLQLCMRATAHKQSIFMGIQMPCFRPIKWYVSNLGMFFLREVHLHRCNMLHLFLLSDSSLWFTACGCGERVVSSAQFVQCALGCQSNSAV